MLIIKSLSDNITERAITKKKPDIKSKIYPRTTSKSNQKQNSTAK